LDDSNLTEELNNLFMNSKTYTSNKNIDAETKAQNISKKDQLEKPNIQYSNYIFYYFVCVLILIISNLLMKYK